GNAGIAATARVGAVDVGADDVEPPIAIDVAQGHALRLVTDGVVRAIEGAAAPAEQDADRVAGVVGRDQVDDAVAVQVAGAHRVWPASDRRRAAVLEGAVTAAEQDADGV